MRILHIQRVAGIGGSERHLLMLLPALKASGLDVTMCVLDAGNADDFISGMSGKDIETVRLPAGGDIHPLLLRQLSNVIEQTSPDLVHTHLIHADFYGQAAGLWSRVPGVSTVHGTAAPYRREPSRTAAALAYHRARLTIAISHHVAQFIRTRRLAPNGRVRMVPYGIDAQNWGVTESERHRQRADLGFVNEVVVVIASRLIPDKGHHELLDAFAAALRFIPELRLVVAGTGPLGASLAARVDQLGLGTAVTFLGFVQDMRSLLGAADVVAFPSMPAFGEGFGLVNLEAMSAGRPVLATGVDSIPEIVVPGETGVLVPPGDVAALRNAIVSLASDASARARMGAAGRTRAIETFSLDRMIDSTIAVYQEARDAA